MKNKILRDISSSSFQVIINQFSGLAIFYVISKELDKSTFGEINWSTALLVTVFNILSLGMDQITIKKIASGEEDNRIIRVYFTHSIIFGSCFYLLLLISSRIFTSFFDTHSLLLFLGVTQLVTFLSTPFKQFANGMEKFSTLFVMSTAANLQRAILLVILFLSSTITVTNILYVYLFSSLVELGICLLLAKSKLGLSLRPIWLPKVYSNMFKESLPLLGSVLFNSAIARFDWILLGFLSTSIAIANYSFAYKVFELSTLPLLMFSPLLLPKLSRVFRQNSEWLGTTGRSTLSILAKYEIVVACFLALQLNICWVPFIDAITDNKYGLPNIRTIFILSASMPFLYLNNLYWSINFANSKLKNIFFIITLTFGINVVADLVFIPLWGGDGAAVAYAVAIIIQTFLYIRRTEIVELPVKSELLICIVVAMGTWWITWWLFSNTILKLAAATAIYLIALKLFNIIKTRDRFFIKESVGI